jgi:hypothetical protein
MDQCANPCRKQGASSRRLTLLPSGLHLVTRAGATLCRRYPGQGRLDVHPAAAPCSGATKRASGAVTHAGLQFRLIEVSTHSLSQFYRLAVFQVHIMRTHLMQ